jgi:hypothetical protein
MTRARASLLRRGTSKSVCCCTAAWRWPHASDALGLPSEQVLSSVSESAASLLGDPPCVGSFRDPKEAPGDTLRAGARWTPAAS